MALAVNPSHAHLTVMGSLEREWQVQAGDQHHGQIEVHNPSTVPLRMRAYLLDLDPRPDGLGFQYPPLHDRSNAAWITLTTSEQVIEAGARAVVHFTIAVPSDLTGDGSWWSVIMIEGLDDSGWGPPATSTSNDATQVTIGVRHVLRTAVRVVTTSGGPLSLAFVDRSLTADDTARVMSLVLSNDGDRNLQLTLHADLFDAQGQPVGRIAPRQAITRLLPGAQATRHLPLPNLPNGDYYAVVIADHRGSHLFGARYSFNLSNAEAAQVVP